MAAPQEVGEEKRVYIQSEGLVLGSWTLPGELVDNFSSQEALGWHVFHELLRTGGPVTVALMTEPEFRSVKLTGGR